MSEYVCADDDGIQEVGGYHQDEPVKAGLKDPARLWQSTFAGLKKLLILSDYDRVTSFGLISPNLPIL